MIRGTTPTLKFTLPFSIDTIDKLYVSICQNNVIVIEKSLYECTYQDNVLSVTLTQEDTLKLSCDSKAEIQIRALTKHNESIASNIVTVCVDRILKDGTI